MPRVDRVGDNGREERSKPGMLGSQGNKMMVGEECRGVKKWWLHYWFYTLRKKGENMVSETRRMGDMRVRNGETADTSKNGAKGVGSYTSIRHRCQKQGDGAG